jgi:phosphatidylglycerol:prolipoprotein diacylglycerol transferase
MAVRCLAHPGVVFPPDPSDLSNEAGSLGMHPILYVVPLLQAPVYSYGTMLYLSFVAGACLIRRLSESDGLDRRQVRACFLVTALFALTGARLLFVATTPEVFHSLGDVFRISDGGIVAYGGFLGGLLGSVLYCRAAGLPLLAWGDCAVPALCSGLFLTRVGCLLAGCDFGRPWNGPWAVQFPPGSPAFRQHVAEGLLPAAAPASLPVHPTQAYESLAGLFLLGVILLARRRRRCPGEALAAFAVGYAVLRFLIETVRADPQRGSVGPFSTSQFIALVTGAAGLGLLAWLRTRRARGIEGSPA